jgi:hypothetical protein
MTDAGEDFNTALDLKLADILSTRREEMANAIFNTGEEVETEGETDEDV